MAVRMNADGKDWVEVPLPLTIGTLRLTRFHHFLPAFPCVVNVSPADEPAVWALPWIVPVGPQNRTRHPYPGAFAAVELYVFVRRDSHDVTA